MLRAMMKTGLNKVFRSRWHALWWAAGICMTAYCSVPSPDTAPAAKASASAPHADKWWMKNSSQSAAGKAG